MNKPSAPNLLSVFLVVLLTSCAGSRNFSFKDAYKFKTIQYARQQSALQTPEQTAPAPTVVEASTESTRPALDLERKINETEQDLLKKLNISQSEAKSLTKEDLQQKINNLSSSEKRTIRKALKKDIREIRKIGADVEHVDSVNDMQSTAKVDGLLRTGIIIGGIGLVLMLIAGIFGFAGIAVYTLGALAFIAGLILILIDVL
jgi:DNA polymerase II small subunit/DNA polymerase delta subunit B